MTSHPGGRKHSRYLIELSFLPSGSSWLHLGLPGSHTAQLLQTLGHCADAVNIPFEQKALDEMSQAQYDGVISEYGLHIMPNQTVLFSQIARLIRRGGKLVFSDTTDNIVSLIECVRKAGFSVRHMEDCTQLWTENIKKTKSQVSDEDVSFVLLICERM